MDELPDVSAQLIARLENLESRVSALERRAEMPDGLPSRREGTEGAVPALRALPPAQPGGALSVMGKAMLGIAGAYLLRAVAESSRLPKLAVAALAFLYAGMWLVWAARLPAGAWFASTAYAATAASILASMLWELTLSFKVLPVPASAGILGAFVIAAPVLTWRRSLASVLWVVYVVAALTALMLSIATRRTAPFIAVLLLMALIGELPAARGYRPSIRPLAAAAADIAIWGLIYIYSSPAGSRPEYKDVGTAVLLMPGPALFLIYGASTAYRTALLRRTISSFEIIQTVISFMLAAVSVLCFGSSAGSPALGVFCLLLSAATYAATFTCFDGGREHRNYHVYAVWSAALFLAGGFLCLPHRWLAAFLSAAAILAAFLGSRVVRLTFEFHGLLYLAAAASVSGLLGYIGRTLAGPFPAAPRWSVWIAAAAAILCYAAGTAFPVEQWQQRLPQLFSAALSVSAAAAFLVSASIRPVEAGRVPSASHLALIRTLILCMAVLLLAFGSARRRRIELGWIADATLVFLAVSLLREGLQRGHPGFLAASIFVYALTLMMVPRLARLGRRG